MKEVVSPNLILVGTAHVSKDSVAEVERVIAEERPDVVAVELDAARMDALENPDRWANTPVQRLLKGDKLWLFLTQMLLASYQRRLGDELGVPPGTEMLAAVRAARANQHELLLADREIGTTMKRAYAHMRFREKMRLMWELFKGLFGGEETEEAVDLEELLKEDTISQLMNELGRIAPSIKRVVIDERDEYLAVKIRRVADTGKKVVAVVGAGHVAGIRRHLEAPPKTAAPLAPRPLPPILNDPARPEWSMQASVILTLFAFLAAVLALGSHVLEADLPLRLGFVVLGIAWLAGSVAFFLTGLWGQERGHPTDATPSISPMVADPELGALETVPVKRFPVAKILGWVLPLSVVGLFVYFGYEGYREGNFEKLRDAAIYWALITGSFAALGALVARGHPLSILTAFVAAPFTTLHPALAAGWFAGLVEAWVRTPVVADFQGLSHLKTMKEFFGNRVIRVLMVAALANVGAMVGFFVAGAEIVSRFVGG